MEPDELYTLRAQYWLGHYQLAMDEAKSIGRRPMSPDLKAEREELVARCFIATGQYDKVTAGDTPGLQALALKAQYESMGGSDEAVLDALKTLAASSPTPAVQLTTAHVLLAAGQTKEALQQVFGGATMEHMSMILQIYLKLDRLDLAKKQLAALKQKDEDAVLTQLGSVYLSLAMGSSGAADGVHVLNSLTEQYGASPFLLNLMAAGLMIQGEYTAAETKLQECLRDFNEVVIPDTLVNMIVCSVQQNKSPAEFVSKLQMQFPSHPFNAGLERVTVAFDRESIKYKV